MNLKKDIGLQANNQNHNNDTSSSIKKIDAKCTRIFFIYFFTLTDILQNCTCFQNYIIHRSQQKI